MDDPYADDQPYTCWDELEDEVEYCGGCGEVVFYDEDYCPNCDTYLWEDTW